MIPTFATNLTNRKLIYVLDMPSFQRDFASLKTLDHGTGPAITFERASGATFFDANGVLQTAANGVARFDHSQDGSANSLGLLIEEQRTNSIRNSQAGGSTNGVIGSGGVLPTNYSTGNLNVSGLTNEVIGTGTESGISFFDYKISGTPTATSQGFINFELSSAISALSGQTWTSSAHIKLQAGSLTNVASVALTIFERDSSDGNLASSTQTFTPTSAALSTQRQSLTRVLNNASTARLLASVRIGYTNGSALDLTLRIAAPQLELGAFPTSYIPTTSAAATRSADSAVVTPIASFYNQAEGSVVVEIQRYATAGSSFTGAVSFSTDADSIENEIYLSQARSPSNVDTVAFLSAIATGQTERAATTSVSLVMGQVTALCAAIKSSDFFVGGRSGAGSFVSATNTNAHTPIAATKLRLGQRANGGTFLNGHIRKVAYFPKRLTNTLLEQLTT